jgi:AcrR family transcriptional regulator
METIQTLPRKKQIELKATELFWEKGYAATSMRDLANSLGIEAASIYSHVKSKEEILQAICFRMAAEFFEAIKEIRDAQLSSQEEKLRLSILAHLQVITKDKYASSVFFDEWRYLSEPSLSKFLRMRDEYEDWFNTIILEGSTKGEFKFVDPKMAVMSILSALNWTHRWYKPQGKYNTRQVADYIANIILNGLKN